MVLFTYIQFVQNVAVYTEYEYTHSTCMQQQNSLSLCFLPSSFLHPRRFNFPPLSPLSPLSPPS